jgi:[ribosomal protein S5]-alanine N-acetyltransferase
MSVTRLLVPDDGSVIAELLRSNRSFLAPWLPRRSEEYFTDEAQTEAVIAALEQYEVGNCVPLAILNGTKKVVGKIAIQSIIRSFFQSCSVGYWLAADAQGQGLATAALKEATEIAFQELRLHRVEAATLTHNVRSQRVLERLGFVKVGVAPAFVLINGAWQDHVLYQLVTPDPGLVAVPD